MPKDFDVVDIPSVLLTEDVCRICRWSVAKLDRCLKDGSFPPPINFGDAKRRRRIWNRDSVMRFLNGQEQSNAKTETSTQRKQRANAARADLVRKGVRVNSEN